LNAAFGLHEKIEKRTGSYRPLTTLDARMAALLGQRKPAWTQGAIS